MNRDFRKGSALLIVLGFLSFMIVSAVAFAVWMRTERVPSSALRRSIANRYLVKAALAQAMSRVDDAVRSHVFPGAWNTNNQSAVYRDGNGSSYDWWESRVFMPPDPEGVSSGTDPNSRYAPISKTVSVLNLEALGYLPPAIANDVRLLARSSWAAKWDYFNFDAGRYAFCAVNVSDMLDVNKLRASAPRTSGARVSLASAFRTGENGFTSLNSGAEKFDEAVHVNRVGWNEAPFVSLLDYGLAIGRPGVAVRGDFESPFYNLASGLTTDSYFYESKNATDQRVKGAARQTFITDTWFPKNPASSIGETLDISLPENQPFKIEDLRDQDTLLGVFEKATMNVTKFWDASAGHDRKHGLSMVDIFTMRDYLDEDSVPLSLNMPCVERVPMLAALQPLVQVRLEFKQTKRPDEQGKNASGIDVYKEWTDWNVSVKVEPGAAIINSLLIFPFGEGQTPPSGCTVEAFARLVFVRGPKSNEANPPKISMRSNEFSKNFKPLKESDWNGQVNRQFRLDGGSESGLTREEIENCLLVTLPSTGGQSVSLPFSDDGGKKFDLQLRGGEFTSETPLVSMVQDYELVKNADGSTAKGGKSGDPRYLIGLRPFDENGNVYGAQNIGNELSAADFRVLCDGIGDIRPYLLVWARVKCDDKTVDLVPATIYDDQALNGVNNVTQDPRQKDFFGPSFGMFDESNADSKLPIMRFGCRFQNDVKLSYDKFLSEGGTVQQIDPMESNGADAWSPKSFFTVDPRFNWAPEDWYASDETDLSKWYANVFDNGGILDQLVQSEHGDKAPGRGDRATDPFLFVSNQGYLQSVGELCFLPHLSLLDEQYGLDEHNVLGDGAANPVDKYKAYDGAERSISTVNTMPSRLAFWKSYQNFRTNPDQFEFGANMYRKGLVNGSQSFYINPFTQSHEVMLAAVANTPLSYWETSTNTTFDAKVVPRNTSQYDSARTFQSIMANDDAHKIATFLQHRFEDFAAMVEVRDYNEHTLYAIQNLWADMFDALDWSGTLGRTVGEVYADMEDYYSSSGGGGNVSYSKTYTGDNHGYSALNRLVKGRNASGVEPGIRLHADRAIHKNDLSKPADPLAGEVAGSSATSGTFLDKLTYVDRMFLHSFWRDCFANRQQLFLIFVRAESTALGGTGEGTPAQQGGRAVALVWRDPLPVVETTGTTGADIFEEDGTQYRQERRPHKMRILFYRQFD